MPKVIQISYPLVLLDDGTTLMMQPKLLSFQDLLESDKIPQFTNVTDLILKEVDSNEKTYIYDHTKKS